MTDSRISKLEQALQSLVDLGGIAESTTIVPNVEVITASPTDLPVGYIIVENELGYYIPAVLVSGLTVSNGDKVNLLYVKGTEPIAFQHGSSSSGGGGGGNVWPKDGQNMLEGTNYGTVALLIAAMSAGDIGYLGGRSSSEAVTLNVANVTLQGVGRLAVTFTAPMLISAATPRSRVEDLGVDVDSTGSQAIRITAGPVDFVDVRTEHTNVADTRGFQLEADARLYDCEGIATSTGTTARAVYVTNNAVVEVHRGYFSASGGTADEIFVDGGSTVHLDGPMLAFGNFGGAGDIFGWYIDTLGGVHFVDYVGGTLKEWQFNTSNNLVSSANSRLILGNGSTEAPLNITERSTEPSSPDAEDIYLDDGSNTTSGDPSFRRYTGAAWEDIGGGSASIAIPNPVINGKFDIWQAGTSFSPITSVGRMADRFAYAKVGDAVHDASQSSDVPTVASAGELLNYSLLLDCTTADSSIAASDFCIIQHFIEGQFALPILQKAFDISFWVKATKTGTYCISFRNSPADRSFIAEYTVSASDTWEFKTISVLASPTAGSWNYTTGAGLVISWALSCGSTFHTTAGSWQTGNFIATSNQVNATDSTSNNFRLALVKIANTFIPDPGIERVRCQRYFFDLPQQRVGLAINGDNLYGGGVIMFPTTMRVAPSLVSGATFTVNAGSAGTPSISLVSTTGVGISNSDNNWTTNALVDLTAKFNAEFY